MYIDVCNYENFGFKTQILSEQVFDIVCVTKRNTQKDIASFHLPITGEVKVRTLLETAHNGVSLAHTVVSFNGKDYDLCGIRNGLGGAALVICIHNNDNSRYTEWELYTDTPSAKSDHDGEVTSEMIRQRANHMINLW